MPNCPACGAPITHAQLADGTRIPLETYTEPTGDRRYTVDKFGPPLIVKPVADSSTVGAWPDHRKECPDFDDGRLS